MFSRFKEAITKNTEEDSEANRKKSVDISFLSGKEVEEYRKNLSEIAKHISEISDITLDNKESIIAFIKEQQNSKK